MLSWSGLDPVKDKFCTVNDYIKGSPQHALRVADQSCPPSESFCMCCLLLLSHSCFPSVRMAAHCSMAVYQIDTICFQTPARHVHGIMAAGSATHPYNGDGARAVQAVLKQAAHVLRQAREADERSCQAAALVSRRDDIIACFTNEHKMLEQLTEQFEGIAVDMQQRRSIAGNQSIEPCLCWGFSEAQTDSLCRFYCSKC